MSVSASQSTMRVKLIRKLADVLNGIDLTKVCVGDVVDLKTHHAVMLVAEGWAQPVKNGKLREPEDRQSR